MTPQQAQLEQAQRLMAERGRVFLNIVNEGLQALLAAAHAGDPQAQAELDMLRGLLRTVVADADPKARILIPRGPVMH